MTTENSKQTGVSTASRNAEINNLVGKRVEVVRDDNVIVIGTLKSTSTCADGSLGLNIDCGSCDRWVSPDFKSIKQIEVVELRVPPGNYGCHGVVLTAEQKKLQIAMNARDSVRDMAATNCAFESELHKMADRLDQIAKQIGIQALLLKH